MSNEGFHNDFDNSIKQRFEGHEMPLTDDLWDAIENNVAKLDTSKKKRRRFLFFRWLSGLLILTLIGVVSFYEIKLKNVENAIFIKSATNGIDSSVTSESNLNNKNQLRSSIGSDQENTTDHHKANNSVLKNKKTNFEEQNYRVVDLRKTKGNTPTNFNQAKINQNKARALATTKENTLNKDNALTITGSNAPNLAGSIKPMLSNGSANRGSFSSNASQTNTSKSEEKGHFNKSSEKETNANSNSSKNVETEINAITESWIPMFMEPKSFTVINQNFELIPLDTNKAQYKDNTPKLKKKKPSEPIAKKLSITTYGEGGYGYRFLMGNSNSSNVSKVNLNSFEKGGFTLSGGAYLRYTFTDKWAIFIGGEFYHYRQSSISEKAKYLVDPNNQTIYVNSSLGRIDIHTKDNDEEGGEVETASLQFTSNQRLNVISIPFGTEYSFINNKKQRLYINPTFYPSFVLGAKAITSNPGELSQYKPVTSALAEVNKFYLGFGFGLGFEQRISKKAYLMLNPQLKYAATPVANIQGVKTHPFSLGMRIGLTYKFKQ